MKKLILLLMAALVFGGLFATPLTEGFESLTCPADGWSIRYANPSPPSGNIMTHSTTYYLDDQRSFRFSSYSSATTYDQYLITPKLSVTANDQTVSFWYRKYDYGSEVFRVGWSLTGTELTDFTWSDDITNASTNWQQYTKTDLPIGTTYVAVHYKSNYQYYLYLDRFVGPEMAIDPEPSNHVTSFNTGTLGYTTIQLNWTGSTGAQLPAGYLIQGIKTGVGSYAAVTDNTPVPNDTDWSDGNAAINVPHAIGANSYTFMGLTPNTAYEFKIWPYTNSGANVDFKIDGSIPTVNASTRDATIYAVDLPHTENFDGVAAPNLPDGWLSLDNNGDGDKWETYNYNAHSAPNAVRIYTDYNTNNDDYLVTPRVQLTGNQRMRFWTRANSTGEPDEISILLSSTTPEAANFTIVAMPSTPINFTTYTEYTVDLSDYTGFHYIAFTRKDAPADGWYLYVDDVTIENIPTTAIFNLDPDVDEWNFGRQIINTTASKTFKVTNTGGAPLVFESVSVSGDYFDPEGGSFDDSDIPAGEDRNFTVEYKPTVEGNHEGELEFVLGRQTITVDLFGECFDPTIVYTDLPYSTSFENVWAGTPAAPEIGWSVVNVNADSYTWRRGPTYITAHTGSYIAQGMGNTNDWMISPPIETGANVRLKWWDRVESANYPNSYKVMLSTTNTQPTSFIELADITCNWTTWTEHTLTFDNTSGTAYIAFYQYASGSTVYDFGIDDFLLEEVPDTPTLSITPILTEPWDFGDVLINDYAEKSFTISNSGPGTITINDIDTEDLYYSVIEVEPIDHSLEGTDTTTFKVRFAPQAVGTFEGTVTINYGTRDEYTIDFKGNGFPYGISTATNTTYGDVGQLILGSFANPATTPDPIMGNPAANAMYTDYTALGPIDIQATVPTPVDVLIFSQSTYWYNYYVKVFIDYNQNLSFDVPDEVVFEGIVTELGNPITGFITLPVSATLGNTRMRIVAKESGTSENTLPVGTYGYGETEDYTVNITAPPAVIAPSDLTATNVNGDSALLGWTENNTPPATNWHLVYGVPPFDHSQATPINIGSNPYPLTGLSPSTTYQWYVRADMGSSGTSYWAGPGTFTTTQIPATLPFTEDWESGQNDWTIVNGSQTNAWHIGIAGPYDGDYSAYISNDGGVSNAYTLTSTSVTHIYRDIDFDDDCLNFPLTFQWKCNGEGTTYVYDYLQVHLVDTSVVPVAGTLLSSGTLGTYNQQTTWQQANITLPGSYSGTSKRLVFSWRNDTSIGNQPPANIDNIILTAVPVPTGPVEPPILIYPEIRQENLPITGFPYQFGWNTGGTEPETYILYIAALDDLSENFDMDEFFNVAESYEDNVTSPYTPDFTYAYEKWYVWTVSGSNTTYPDEVFEWPPYEFKIEQDPTVTEEDFPWCVDFENVPTQGFPLSGWTVHNLDGGGSTWNSTTSYNTTPSGSYAAIHPYGMNDEEGWMITPPIELPDNPCELKFWHYNYFPTWYEYSGVWVTIGDPDPVNGNWTELWNPVSVTDSWEQEIILLDDYANETIHLAFVYEGYNAHDWIIDDICVQLQPTELLAPILVLPADNAENMPKTGFSFTWEKDTMSVTPDSYTLYLSKNPATLLSDHIYTGIIGTSFDPTQAPSPVSFAYEEDWYWTIGAVKAGHNEEIATHRKFTIQIDPTILEEDLPWCDGFESYDDFAIFFSPWTNVDVDQSETYGMNGIDWLNEYQPQAFIIYNPSETTPALTGLDAYEGDKMAACFAAVMPADGGNGPNNDWLITPPIEGVNGLTASFWARSYTDEYGLDRFRVGVSTNGTNPSNFTIISEGPYIEAPDEWTEYIFPLQYPGQIIHVGIHCVSNDSFFLLVDKFCLYKEDSGLIAPEISIDLDEGYPTISWPAVAGATAYKVYGSQDPYAADPWTLLTSPTTPDTGFTYTGTAAYHFFKVTAVAPDDKGLAAPARKPGPKLPTQKRTTAEIPQYKTRNK